MGLLGALVLAATGHATIDAALQMQLGNPSSATTDTTNHAHYLIQRAQYALDYDDTTHEPNWVSWDLTTSDVGSSGRASDFFVDTTLPAGFYQVQTTDYSGSGYDRGHMCPSADRTVTRADNDFTFYMSNMVPQTPDNNQGVWANFESYTRSLAAAGNEILIVSGPSGFGGSAIASGVAIPGYTWKIVLVVPIGSGSAVTRITPATRIIAIKIPNIAGVRSSPWQNFVTSVAQIEADTGYTFLTALPAPTAAALRTVVDGQSAVGAPAIVAQPSPQTTVVGGSATFTVSATGDAPLAYQWSRDDNEISGATNATLTLNNIQAADVGAYTVVVSNAIGSATSNPAALIVNGLPPSITTSPASQTVGAGSTVTFSVAATGSPTLAYQWRKDTVAINGATSSTLTLTNVQSANAGGYDVIVTNSVNSATSAAATLTVTPAAPTITGQPVAKTVSTGSNASFTVVAAGTAPLAYQWRKGGVPLGDGGAVSGTATATLLFTSVSAVNAGDYDVVVTNGLGFATSNVATLTVSPPPAATVYWNFGTDTPTSGLTADISGGQVTQGNNNGTTTLLTSSSVSSGYTGASAGNNAGAAARIGALNQGTNGSAYFEFTLAPSAGKRLLASGISFGMRSTSTGPQAFGVYSSLDGFTTPLASGTVPNNGNWALYTPAFTTVTGATGTAVTFRIYGYNGTGSPGAGTANWRIDDLTLTVTTVFPPPVAPVVTATFPANGATGVAVANPITITFNEAVSFTGSWFTINSALNGPIAATVTGGPTIFTLTPPSFFANSDTLTVNVLGGQVVDQATGTIHGTSDTTFSFTTEIFVPPTPPSVTTQPISQSVNAGGTATFTVGASGTAPLSYQWRKNTVAIAGNTSATTATLTLSNVTTADAGSYDCLVSNVAGSDVSHTATLAVTIVPPTIATQPSGQSAAVGGSASFTVVANGSAPFTYQWRKNGSPLANNASVTGANAATLSLINLAYTDSGSYDVVVTNAASFATSLAATLAVTDAAPGPIYWDFATAAPTSGVPAGVTGGTVAQGNNNGTTTLITSTSASSSYTGASAGNNAGAAARIGALNQGTNGSAYFEFGFTAPAGRQLAVTGISFGMRSTSTGPQAFALFSSLDNFAAPLATGAVPNDSVWRLYSPAFAGVTGTAGGAVTFRIYGYNGTGSPGAGTANWRIDDLKLNAGLLAIPLPPTITTQPIAQTATVGDAVSFTVAATGTGSLSYQWRKDGTPVAGNPSATTPTLSLASITSADAGSYDCIVSNFVGNTPSDAARLTVNKATATVTLGTLGFTFDGTPHATTATTSIPGLTVVITYGGGSAAPTNAGSYAVVATIDDANYAGSATGTLVISPANASVTLGDLGQIYNGSPRPVTAVTTPAGLAVSISYNGNPTPPVNAGIYPIVATIIDPNYVGSAQGDLLIAKAPASLSISQLAQTFDGSPKPVTVTTNPSGLNVTVTYDGSTTAPTNAGSYGVVATVNHPNYSGTAKATLVISPATATITLSDLVQAYDGTPKSVVVTTVPEDLKVSISYNGNPVGPTNPGTYPVVVTITDPNYAGSISGNLVITVTALVRHAPSLNGGLDGSIQVLQSESTTLNSSAWVAGDLLAPGMPTVVLNGHATYGGTQDGQGSASPANYSVTLNSAVLRHVIRRTDPISLPTVSAPPAPAGTRNVTLNTGQSAGDFTTLRNLTLNSGVGQVPVPPGTYGSFTANKGSGFTLGVAGAMEPAVYNLQNLTVNSGAQIQIVGPVVINLANGTSINGLVGSSAHPEWLTFNVASGDVAINSGEVFHGAIIAPAGTLTINGTVHGLVASDRLTINSSGLLDQP